MISLSLNQGFASVHSLECLNLIINEHFQALRTYRYLLSPSSLGQISSPKFSSNFEQCHEATSLIHIEQCEKNLRRLCEALEDRHQPARLWLMKSYTSEINGNKNAALKYCEEAINSNPYNYESLYRKAHLLFWLGRFDEAVIYAEQALGVRKDDVWAWIKLVLSLINSGKLEEAISSAQEGLRYIDRDVQPENWAWLHETLGQYYAILGRIAQDYCGREEQSPLANLPYSLRFRFPESYYKKALHHFKSALKVFMEHKTFYRLGLCVIEQITGCYQILGDSKTANHYHVNGLALFRELYNDKTNDSERLKLESNFFGFSRKPVTSLVEDGHNIVALETAERYKNRCLTWILDEWKEQVISPSYAEMRQLLNPQTAIVYWHFSDDSLTTFILTPNSEEPILLNTLQYDRAQKLQSWIKNWNTQYNDYRTEKDNQSDHPWRRELTTQLNKLREILNIDGIVQHLTDIERLILIPHRDLHRFPLHAFFPLFTTYYLPSIQIGLTLQNKPQSTYPIQLLSIEDPKTDRPQMPYAQLESALICHLFAQAARLDETAATVENVTNALGDRHTHFHFTGHAGYDTPPENSALILSNDERLTAKTIRHLDLSHYELIALSACETALTGNQSIETEFVGLVSAFLQAGATAVLSTLWNVNEISSTWLILKFYELQMPPAEALKTAQNWLQSLTYEALLQWLDRWLTILPVTHPYHQDIQDEITLIQEKLNEHKIDLQQTPYSDPYHWAAFTLTGRGL